MKEFNVTLTTSAIAPFVWLDADQVMGRFSDNGFLMVHPQKVVTFYSWDGVTVDNLKAALSVKTLMNIYFEKHI
jgi:beta-mannosidase